jgi:2-methylcitrate dehydratase PrpD
MTTQAKPAARTLAEFAVGLRYESIPAAVVERAKAVIIDTVAASAYGAHLPWSKIVVDYVLRTSAPGLVGVFGGAVAAGCLMGLDAERLTDDGGELVGSSPERFQRMPVAEIARWRTS